MAERGQVTLFGLAAVLVILVARDFVTVSGSTRDVPTMKFNNLMGPTLRFLYWKVFEQYANILREKYPDISILGDNYPPPDWRLWLAQLLGGAKLIILVMIIANINVWEWLGQEVPSWWAWFVNNKIYGCMMVFFLCNALEGQLVSTGAFEISFNDVPVWSKLETGRIPQPPELFQIIDNHVRFNQNSNSWSDNI